MHKWKKKLNRILTKELLKQLTFQRFFFVKSLFDDLDDDDGVDVDEFVVDVDEDVGGLDGDDNDKFFRGFWAMRNPLTIVPISLPLGLGRRGTF